MVGVQQVHSLSEEAESTVILETNFKEGQSSQVQVRCTILAQWRF